MGTRQGNMNKSLTPYPKATTVLGPYRNETAVFEKDLRNNLVSIFSDRWVQCALYTAYCPHSTAFA